MISIKNKTIIEFGFHMMPELSRAQRMLSDNIL